VAINHREPHKPEDPQFPLRRLVVAGVSCVRGERSLFADLAFTLKAGEAMVLTGPNGAGKTSLLRILAGLLRPERGSISIEPAPADTSLATLSRFIGVRDGLKPALTPRETLRFMGAMLESAAPGDAALASALQAFGLVRLADMPNAWLSTGQRRRVVLSSLLLAPSLPLTSRPLWLLDEPVNGLDSEAATQLAEVVAIHREGGGMVIAASHQKLDWPDLREFSLGTANLAKAS
jgi:heme exporter protein A